MRYLTGLPCKGLKLTSSEFSEFEPLFSVCFRFMPTISQGFFYSFRKQNKTVGSKDTFILTLSIDEQKGIHYREKESAEDFQNDCVCGREFRYLIG